MMELLGKSDDISKNDYIEWPLFKEFRKTEAFADSFTKIYGEAYESIPKVEVKSLQDIVEFKE